MLSPLAVAGAGGGTSDLKTTLAFTTAVIVVPAAKGWRPLRGEGAEGFVKVLSLAKERPGCTATAMARLLAEAG